MPRPSSSTVTLESMWMVTSTRVQKPARASSMELSTTSKTRWCRPRSAVSPMYIPGRFRTASRPSRTLMFSAPYPGAVASLLLMANRGSGRTRDYTVVTRGVPPSAPIRMASEAHRHEHVREGRILRSLQHPGADFVGQPELDHVPGRMRGEHVEEVAGVESDGHRLARIRHFDVFGRLTLLRIAGRHLERPH